MRSQKYAFILPITIAAISLLAPSAGATTISFGGVSTADWGMYSSVAKAKTISLDAPMSTDYSMVGSKLHSGSYVDYYLAPKNDTSRYESVAFGQTAINFTSAVKYFGLYWGSIDMYNSISLISGNTMETYSGAKIASLFTSDTRKAVQYGDSAMYVNFAAENGASWNKILLKSTGWSFESANLAYESVASGPVSTLSAVSSVPEPSTVLMGLAGITILAVSFSRKRVFAGEYAS